MFIAFTMTADWNFDSGRSFKIESEADAYGIKATEYAELDPDDDPDHWKKYDPPIVVVFEAENTDAMMTGKFTRPVAIYRRGEKWVCTKSSER